MHDAQSRVHPYLKAQHGSRPHVMATTKRGPISQCTRQQPRYGVETNQIPDDIWKCMHRVMDALLQRRKRGPERGGDKVSVF